MHDASQAVLAGVEPDEPEDISDFERLMNPVAPARSEKTGRNEPCPCGSGKKYRRCWADKEERADPDDFSAGRFRYEPGSCGGPGSGYMPSILCYERSGPDSWQEHFCLVNPDEDMQDDPEAASAIAQRHLETAFARGGKGSTEDFAMFLKTAGYVLRTARPTSIFAQYPRYGMGMVAFLQSFARATSETPSRRATSEPGAVHTRS